MEKPFFRSREMALKDSGDNSPISNKK